MGIVLGSLIVFFEIATVLVLHPITQWMSSPRSDGALYIHRIVIDLSPTVDGWVLAVSRLISH